MQKESAKAEVERQRARWIWDIAHEDETSFTAFYASTVDSVYSLALRITRIPALAEEVVEATYFYVWENASRFEAARGSVITWLLVICRSQALMLLRSSHQHMTEYFDAELCSDTLGTDDDPQSLLAATEENGALHAALTHLCARDRQILALAFFLGFTHAEIGIHLDMSVGTVKTRIRSAIEILRTQLKSLRCKHAGK